MAKEKFNYSVLSAPAATISVLSLGAFSAGKPVFLMSFFSWWQAILVFLVIAIAVSLFIVHIINAS